MGLTKKKVATFLDRLTRKKIVDFSIVKLKRVLTLFDLTFLGIGSTIGVGFYVLVGNVARTMAGPAVIISFLIAGIASIFAGLCYAEFAGRVPKAGSAYVYSYVCVGECVAFVIGWNLVLEYIIGAASVARGFSGYIDALANHTMSEGLREVMPMNVDFLSDYPDFLSFGFTFVVSGVLAFGIKESSIFNNVFSSVNMVVVIYVIIAASTKIKIENWQLAYVNGTVEGCNTDENPDGDWGTGGFSPYGFTGIMRGAATCFFGFVGFDGIATTGEEAINPSRNIPMAISISLLVIFVAYVGMATTITLALPYCLQDPDAALVSFFDQKEMPISMWIVSIGALFGFSASLIGVLLPLPRIIYAMANDGVIFRFLGAVNKRFKTPFVATLITGFIAGVMALIFNLESLVDMMSIGTLMAYTIVAVSVMLLRYVPDEDEDPGSSVESFPQTKRRSSNVSASYSTKDIMEQLFNFKQIKEPTVLSGSIASYATLVYCLMVAILSLLLVVLNDQLFNGEVGAIVGVSIVLFLNIVNVVIIGRQPESKKTLAFKVPFVPWMPAVSALVNVYLMFNLTPPTWIRFAVWMGVGMPIYFFYGMSHSTEELRGKDGKFGIDNPGGPKDFIIPTINVQLATPLSSAHNTPKTLHKVKKEPPPISPLALERKTKTQSSEDCKEGEGPTSEENIQKVLESLDKIVDGSIMMNEAEETSHDNAAFLQDEGEGTQNTSVQSRELPPIPPESSETRTHDQSDSSEGSTSTSYDSKYESLANVLSNKERDGPNTEERNIVIDPQYETINDMKIQVAEMKTQNKSDSPKPNAPVMAELLQKETKIDEIDGNKSNEVIYATVDKASKKRPEPLDFGNLIDSRRSSLQSSSSAPQMPYSSPSTPIPLGALSSRGSFPNTPIGRRHPTKLLKRNSSFDEIPPSSLDSPLVRRVDKFFIIPVREPDLTDSDTGSPQPSPSPTIHSESKGEEGQENLMSELQSKFSKFYDSEREKYDEDSPKSRGMFYVSSNESLENMSSSGDLPSPTTPSHVREFKRISSNESSYLGEVLDTIRERGESKIYSDDSQTEGILSHEKSADIPNDNAQESKVTTILEEENPHKETHENDSSAVVRDTEKDEGSPSKDRTKVEEETIQEDAQSSPNSGPPTANNENVHKLKALFGS